MDVPVILQNSDIIIVDKPAGWLTVPARERDDPRPVLGLHVQQELGQQIYPVHRLDEPVTGLVLFAKTPAAHRSANRWFEGHLVQKTYRAWTSPQCYSHIPASVQQLRPVIAVTPGQGYSWSGQIKRGKRRAYQHHDGKPTHTDAVYLGLHVSLPDTLRWDLNPVTGRSHQLRVDLSRHGFPVIGDELYGSVRAFHPDAIALTAWKLDFTAVPGHERLGLPEVVEIAVEWDK